MNLTNKDLIELISALKYKRRGVTEAYGAHHSYTSLIESRLADLEDHLESELASRSVA